MLEIGPEGLKSVPNRIRQLNHSCENVNRRKPRNARQRFSDTSWQVTALACIAICFSLRAMNSLFEIGQVAITVGNVERSTTFFRDVLGLKFLFAAGPNLAFFA